jgi:hypothetical protein
MNRRKFLSAVSSGAALAVPTAALTATWPHFLRSAFAEPSPPGSAEVTGLAVVSEGFRRAQRAGKPLLVLIIPRDDAAKWERGRAFGAWLNHGSAEQLWPLALCEVACATLDDLRRLVPTVGLGDPLMIVVETAAVPVTVTRLDAKLVEPPGRRPRPSSVEAWREQQRLEEAQVDQQIATLARLARKGLVDSPASGNQRAVPTGAAAMATLAEEAKARLLHQRVPGSHWASSMGCGTRVEGHPEIGRGIQCGMGHVPEKSARFLYFYTIPKDPKQGDGIIL